MERSNKTRRSVIRGSFAVAAGSLMLATQAKAQDQKIGQALVQYQAMPKDGAECDKCVNWVAPNACKIVEGQINPKGWCVAYAPKEG